MFNVLLFFTLLHEIGCIYGLRTFSAHYGTGYAKGKAKRGKKKLCYEVRSREATDGIAIKRYCVRSGRNFLRLFYFHWGKKISLKFTRRFIEWFQPHLNWLAMGICGFYSSRFCNYLTCRFIRYNLVICLPVLRFINLSLLCGNPTYARVAFLL